MEVSSPLLVRTGANNPFSLLRRHIVSLAIVPPQQQPHGTVSEEGNTNSREGDSMA